MCRPNADFRRILVEDPLLQHEARAALFTIRRAFFGRLKDEQHVAGQRGAHRA